MNTDEAAPRHRTVRIPIVGFACIAGDRVPLEHALQRLSGVSEAYVNAADDAAHLDVDPDTFSLEEALRVIGAFGARGITTGAMRDMITARGDRGRAQ